LSDVEDICDRVIILYGGQVRAEGALDKLLTVSDQTRILTPQLPKAVMDKLLELLRANLDGEEFKIDHPRRTLEEFFLDVIAQARRESVETAGVAGSGGIAEYLAGEDEDDEKSALLNTLMKEPVTPEFKKSEAVEQDVAEKAVEVSADDRIASALKEVTAKVEKENTPAEESGKKAENMRRANSKLDSLLGDKSGE